MSLRLQLHPVASCCSRVTDPTSFFPFSPRNANILFPIRAAFHKSNLGSDAENRETDTKIDVHRHNIKPYTIISEDPPTIRSKQVSTISGEFDKLNLRFRKIDDRNILIMASQEILCGIVGCDEESLVVFEDMARLGVLGKFRE